MIPYIDIPALHLVGSLRVQPFGVLVALGLVTGYAVARREARRRGLDEARIGDLVLWTVVGGFVLAHLVSAIFYFPDEVARNPWELLKVWDSLSSYGGFAGGALGALIAIRRYRLPLWPTVDTLAAALIAGWFFGRLGCTVVHDHPGRLSDFFLAVNYPGGARHDLGFDEWLFTIGLNVTVFLMLRRDPPPGSVLALLMIAYAPVRFGLDFLRTADRHYLGLTPGQYFSVALLIGGLLVLRRVRSRRELQPK
ncbi:MAG: prolipoprotein diacylglyceryl transferase [Candidatus Krumholzibacteriia bacterium]|nr:prolipoprotein diacylglyceryl transferase [bacterium]MCB9515707.1 prolipoprotein diacylglyceryl transferase [Candidatus Latescibacterota bacterium]